MGATRRIGILTGGGDVPGLNPVIKSVVYRATELGYEVLGIRRGWQGLTHLRQGPDPDAECVRPLDRINTRGIDRTGGTVLHTSRTNPRKMRRDRLPPPRAHREPVGERQLGQPPVRRLEIPVEALERRVHGRRWRARPTRSRRRRPIGPGLSRAA